MSKPLEKCVISPNGQWELTKICPNANDPTSKQLPAEIQADPKKKHIQGKTLDELDRSPTRSLSSNRGGAVNPFLRSNGQWTLDKAIRIPAYTQKELAQLHTNAELARGKGAGSIHKARALNSLKILAAQLKMTPQQAAEHLSANHPEYGTALKELAADKPKLADKPHAEAIKRLAPTPPQK
jgi:hypothetical protein